MTSIRRKDAFVAQKELASASKLCLYIAINSELNYFNCRNISHKSAKGFPAEEYSLLTGTHKETSAKICYFRDRPAILCTRDILQETDVNTVHF